MMTLIDYGRMVGYKGCMFLPHQPSSLRQHKAEFLGSNKPDKKCCSDVKQNRKMTHENTFTAQFFCKLATRGRIPTRLLQMLQPYMELLFENCGD